MVTSESNRTQSSVTSPFERQTQAFQQPAEAVAAQPIAEHGAIVSLHEPYWFMSLMVAGATIASTFGLGAVVLAILGLSGAAPQYMLPVAAMVSGLAFLMLGSVDTAWARMFRFPEHETSRDRIVIFSGHTAVLIAGLAAVVLSILNFAFLGDVWFSAVAIIAMGFGLLWHSGTMRRVSHFTDYVAYHEAEGHRPHGPFAINALTLAPVRDFLVGLGGIVLGILVMMNIAPMVLGFVALLLLGVALAGTASTICGASLATLKGACSKS